MAVHESSHQQAGQPDPTHFIERWEASSAAERANAALFLSELCDLLGVPRPNPATADVRHNAYTFERAVTLNDGEGQTSTGFIDLYKRGTFVLEAKQGSDNPTFEEDLAGDRHRLKAGTARRETRAWERAMKKAKEQALRYARALPASDGWPPFLVVVDVGYCIDLYADFSRQGKTYVPFPDPARYRIFLGDLVGDAVREWLRLVWTDPMALDPTRRSARVTRELAGRLADLAGSLEAAGHAPDVTAGFLMRCLFTMFAEDVGLLPERGFTELLKHYREKPGIFPDAVSHLWERMNAGGFSPSLEARIPQFNGGLFADQTALMLTPAQIDLLIKAAEAEWKDVEPAIFGTLLERALDPRERHKLGAHFTPRAYVERLVLPTIVEPLREEWNAVQAAAVAREAEHDEAGARDEIETFHRRLCSLRVLDPACGSGNFLYVTLEHLKRLEGEVMAALTTYAGQQVLDMTGGYTVTPAQLLGMELNPRAAAIADVVLWIGYLQWHFRTYGHARRLDPPILRQYKNIVCRDAVLVYDERVPRRNADGSPATRWDGHTTKVHPVTEELVPDDAAQVPIYDYTNPRPADWPAADFIVGNPPFVGNKRMRLALGDGYVEALRKAYRGQVPDSADYVMYWWHKAAEKVDGGEAERFGFITTNSLTQTYNRAVVEAHLDGKAEEEGGLALAFAVPDHPWVDDVFGAAVRISMTVAAPGADGAGRLATVVAEADTDDLGRAVELVETQGTINADLTVGADVTSANKLKANAGLSFRGMTLVGGGFVLEPKEADRLRQADPEAAGYFVQPHVGGRDLVQRSRDLQVIDFFGLTETEAADAFPVGFQRLYDRVKPERDAKAGRTPDSDEYARTWWLFAKTRPELRSATADLARFIVTPRTAKHRVFTFVLAGTVPESEVVAFASDDAYILGVLQSRFHVLWSLASGGRLGVGNDPRYSNTKSFDPFPFPAATDTQRDRVRTIGERLDAHRKRVQAAHADLTLTGLYNVLEKVRADETLADADREVYERGLVGVLRQLHDELDAAVAEAYGWPVRLPAPEVLRRLVELNHERAQEEAQGLVRYLRPVFQNPKGVQQTALDVKVEKKAAKKASTKLPWPKPLPERVQAVQRILATEHGPFTAKELAARFSRAKADQVAPLLSTLEVLGLVRRTAGEGAYVA